MATLLELRNQAREYLAKARAAYEADDKAAGDALMAKFKEVDGQADDIQGREDIVNAAFEKYDGTPSQQDAATIHQGNKDGQAGRGGGDRDPTEALIQRGMVAADEAKGAGVRLRVDGKDMVVPYANEKTEGWIKGYPASVQHPAIIRRLTPELREVANAQVDAFIKYCRFGMSALDDKERVTMRALKDTKALEEGVNAEGGFLVPSDAVRLPVVLGLGTPGGRTRPLTSQFTTTRDAGDWPASTDDVTWAFVAEEGAFSEANPTFSQVPFTIKKYGRINLVSEELLADSAVDIPALFGGLFTRGLGRFEDQQVIDGDNTNDPLGLRTTGATQGDVGDSVAPTAIATYPLWADVVAHYFDLPSQWRDNATWYMTSSLLAKLAGIVGAGIPRVVEFMGDPIRPIILGHPVIMFDGTGWDDAAAIAANEELGAIGDFSQYYYTTRVGMTITRLNERYADTDQIGFKARVRYDSAFAENDAFRILKAAAA